MDSRMAGGCLVCLIFNLLSGLSEYETEETRFQKI